MSTKNGYQPIPGKQLPVPADFPVRWAKEADKQQFWTYAPIFYPDPMPPLGFDLTAAYLSGINVTADTYALPIRTDVRHINSYLFQTIIPVGAPPAAVIKLMSGVKHVAPGVVGAIEKKAVGAISDKYLAHMTPIINRLGDYWAQELQPEVQQFLKTWAAFDLDGASLPDLLAHLEATVAKTHRMGAIHFLIAFPFLLALSQFEELYVDLFGDERKFEAYALLQGFDSKILQGDRAQWQLSRKAMTMPTVHRILAEKTPAAVIPALQETAEGQVFLTDLNDFLAEFGQRGDKFSTVSDVSWIEDPSPVIKTLQDYITQPDRDLEAELAAEAEARNHRVADVRRQLAGYPQPVRDEFERLLKAAQEANYLHSEHGYWLDYCALYQVRRVVQAVGRRLAAASLLDDPDDIFFLNLAEVQQITEQVVKNSQPSLMADTSADSGPGLQARVAERKASLEQFLTIEPPPALGTVPLMPPPDDPFGRALARYFGVMPGTPAEKSTDNGEVRGQVGSPGVARGRAKVVRRLSDAGKVEPGDILIAETTAPPWTPLFATVAAVVTDVGGILSHSAVVAREYHIPAIVGTETATSVFKDGQLVEVNGETGVVQRVEETAG